MRARLPMLLAVVPVLLASGVNAGELQAKPPLAELPSKPGPTIEKIKALGDNAWLDLGVPAADPKWGTACGRSWGSKAFVLAPELRGAFLTGEGRHGFVKADGHAMDDLWFYDINAHRWICLYPGVVPKTFTQQVKDKEITVDELGRIVDKDGQHLPIHKLVHAWGFLAYDTDQKKFAYPAWLGPTVSTYYLGNGHEMLEGLELLKEQGLGKKGKPRESWSPFYYDVQTGKWEIQPAAGGIDFQGGPVFIYAPSIKKFLLLSRQGTATYDPAKRAWNVKPASKLAKAWVPFCLDTKRNRVHHGHAIYDIASETWIDPQPAGEAPSLGDTNNSAMEYDAANDKVVVIQWAQPGNAKMENGIYVYDAEANAWSGPTPIPPKTVGVPTNVCYVPELNVYLCYVAGDSEPGGHMWAYRYKKAAK